MRGKSVVRSGGRHNHRVGTTKRDPWFPEIIRFPDFFRDLYVVLADGGNLGAGVGLCF